MIGQVRRKLKHSKTTKTKAKVKPKVTVIDLSKVPQAIGRNDLKQRRAERAEIRRNSSNSISPNNSTLLKLSAVENLWNDMKQNKISNPKSSNPDQILELTQTANVLLKNIQDNLKQNKVANALPKHRNRKTRNVLTIIKNKL